MTGMTLTLDRAQFTTTQPALPDFADTISQSRIHARPRPVYLSPEENKVNLSIPPTSLILLAALADPRFRLLRPVLLWVEKGSGGEYIVSNPDLHGYGAGRTLQTAVSDYQSMLVDLYEELAASEANLSRQLRVQLDHLRGLIASR